MDLASEDQCKTEETGFNMIKKPCESGTPPCMTTPPCTGTPTSNNDTKHQFWVTPKDDAADKNNADEDTSL